MIPKGNSVEEIKLREEIIREFYRNWKEKIHHNANTIYR